MRGCARVLFLLALTASEVARAQQSADAGSPTAPDAAIDAGSPPAADDVIDVTVSAPRRTEERLHDSPVAVDVVGRREIETSGARDVAGVLVTQAGIQIERSFAGDGLLMQGLEPQQALIVIDGERLVGARDGVLDLSRIYAADVQQIEIMRGPASAVYGSDAMAGVMNIVTRPPDAALGVSAQGRYGATRGPTSFFEAMPQQGDGWLSATAGTDTLRARLSAGYRHVGGFDLTPDTPSTTAPERDSYGGNARVDWLPSSRFHVPVLLRLSRRDLRAIDEGSGGRAIYDRRQRSDDLTVTVMPTMTVGDDGTVLLSGSYAQQRTQFVRDQRGDDDGDQFEDTLEQLATIRAQAATKLTGPLQLTSGVELLGQQFRSPRLGDTGRRGRASPYAELQWTLSERYHASLLPSARVDVDSQYGVNVSPRLAMRVDPRENLTVRASIGRGFRAPSFSELGLNFHNPAANYRVTGNSDLDPESSIGASVNAELRAERWLRLFVNLFHNELWDLIDTGLVGMEGGEQIFSYLNRRRARTQGLESLLNLRPVKLLTVELTHALTLTRDLEQERELSGRARHRSAARLVLGGGDVPWTLSTRAQLVGRRRYYSDSETGEIASDAPAYLVADARAAYRFGDPLELFANVDNLTDAAPRGTPITPVTFYIGLNVSY